MDPTVLWLYCALLLEDIWITQMAEYYLPYSYDY